MVFKQDPPAGSPVKRGDAITYWVSSGRPQAIVPPLTGLTEAEARAALDGVGLNLGAVTPEVSAIVPTGQVIRQDPAAGVVVAKGSAVGIVVSSGSPSPSPSPTASTVSVPNVLSMDAATATAALEAEGLVVDVKQKGGTSQPPGTVLETSPGAGTAVAVGSTVLLVIAK